MNSQRLPKRLAALKFYSRGITKLNQGQYQQADLFLSHAIEMGCKTLSAYCERGIATFGLAQTQPVKVIPVKVNYDPRQLYYPAAHYLDGVDMCQALEYLNAYIELHPEQAAALAFRGNL